MRRIVGKLEPEPFKKRCSHRPACHAVAFGEGLVAGSTQALPFATGRRPYILSEVLDVKATSV